LNWYFFILFFTYAWGTSDKKWGTLIDLGKIRVNSGKSGEICENLPKIPENLSKLLKNASKNDPKRLLI